MHGDCSRYSSGHRVALIYDRQPGQPFILYPLQKPRSLNRSDAYLCLNKPPNAVAGGKHFMNFSTTKSVSILLIVVFCLLSAATLAARKHTQTSEGLDRLIPRDKWAGAGLDKLTASEQQSLADDIASLLASSHTATKEFIAAKDRTQWRKLQRHMTKDDVKKLLGEPDTVSVSRFLESWYYAGGTVTFDSKGRVDMWTED
jgi:hypothetical protein